MITDKLTYFADSVASGNAGTRTVGTAVDLTALGIVTNATVNGADVGGQIDAGDGQPIYLQVIATEAYFGTVSTDAITFSLVTSATDTLAAGTVLAQSQSYVFGITTDVIALGDTVFQVALPLEGSAYKRYLGVQETVVGTTSTGKFSAFLTLDPRTKAGKAYPQADVHF